MLRMPEGLKEKIVKFGPKKAFGNSLSSTSNPKRRFLTSKKKKNARNIEKLSNFALQ